MGRRVLPSAFGVRGRGFCVFHSGKLDLAELGRRGGKARGKKSEQHAGDKLESLAHLALEELLTNAGGSATARAAAARLVLDKVAASSPYSAELAKRATAAEMEAQRQAELPFARARLHRLIEARAQARAEELHEERRRLELEAVKAEMVESARRRWPSPQLFRRRAGDVVRHA